MAHSSKAGGEGRRHLQVADSVGDESICADVGECQGKRLCIVAVIRKNVRKVNDLCRQ